MKKLLLIFLCSIILLLPAKADAEAGLTVFLEGAGAYGTTFHVYFNGSDQYILTEDSYDNSITDDDDAQNLAKIANSNMGYNFALNNCLVDLSTDSGVPDFTFNEQTTSTDIWVSKSMNSAHKNIPAPMADIKNFAGKYQIKIPPVSFSDKYLNTPQNVTLTGVEGGIKIEWDTVENAEKYLVYRRGPQDWNSDPGNNKVFYSKIEETTDTNYIDDFGFATKPDGNIDTDKSYYYIIIAVGTIDGTEVHSSHTKEEAACPGSGAAATITGLEITPSQTSAIAGETISFTVTAIKSNENNQEVSGSVAWTITGGTVNIDYIKNSNSITFNKATTYTINVQYEDQIAEIDISVSPATLATYEVSAEPSTIIAGGTANITFSNEKDAFGNSVDVTDYSLTEWSNTKEGTYTVPVTADGVPNSVEITVTPAELATIEVSPLEALIEQGQSVDITAAYTDQYGNTKYESETNSYAYDEPGNYEVTFEKDGLSKTASITVIPVIDQIVISQIPAYIEADLTLNVSAIDANGQEVELSEYNLSYTYENADGGVFSVAGQPDGAYTVKVTLTTVSKTLTAEETININRYKPVIKVIDKAGQGEEITDGTILPKKPNLQVTITDLNGVDQEVEIYLDEEPVSASEISAINAADVGDNTITTYSVAYSAASELSVGTHAIKVIARDIFGKETKAEIKELKVYAGVQVIGTPYNYPNPFTPASGQSTTIKYSLANDANVKLVIYDITGRMVYSQLYASGSNGGQVNVNRVEWNGKDALGNTVGNGVYHFLLINEGSVIGRGQMAVLD